MENLNNLCRVCLHKSTDSEGDRPLVILNKTQIEKLIYIGDTSEVVRIDKQPPSLCLQCLQRLDPVYDFVAKFNSSKLKIKCEYMQFCGDGNQNPPQDSGADTKENEHLIDIVKMEVPSFEDDEINNDGIEEVVIDDTNFRISYQTELETDSEAHLRTVPKSMQFVPGRKFKLPKEKRKPSPTLVSSAIMPIHQIKSEIRLSDDVKGRLTGVNASEENICHICTKNFSTRANMLRHVREHLGRRFVCKYENCNSIFTQKSSLNVHILKHEDIKPYQCQACEKKFSQSKSLVFHIRTHTGESPFECVYCEKKFKQKSNLIRHFKSHSKPLKPRQNRFECHKCQKFLASKQSLRRHLERHDRLGVEFMGLGVEFTKTEAIKIENKF